MPKYLKLLASFILFSLALVGAKDLKVTTDASAAMLPTDIEAQNRYADYLSRFPNDQGAVLVVENLICSSLGWSIFVNLEKELRNSSLIERTLSIASPASKYITSTSELIDLQTFSEVEFDTAQDRCSAAENYEPFSSLLINSQFDAALFVLAETEIDPISFAAELERIVGQFDEKAREIGGLITVTGEPIMSAEVSRVVERDSIYVVVTLLLLTFVIYFLTRSLKTVLATLMLCIFVLALTYGSIGWAGLMLTPATSLVIFLLVPLSAAFVIHAHGFVVRQAEELVTVKLSKSAFLLAGITTAIGFAFTGMTPAKDIQLLAIMGIIGIVAATLGIFLFVFPLLENSNEKKFVYPILLSHKVLSNPAMGYSVLFSLLFISAIGLSRIEFNYGPTKYLPDTNPIRSDFLTVGEKFGRMNVPLVVHVPNVNDPEVWNELSGLADKLEKFAEGKIQVSWFYEQMSSLSKAVSLDEKGAHLSFPSTSTEFAQLLLLFEPSDLELYIDQEQESILMMLQIPFEGSKEYLKMKSMVDQFFRDSDLDGYLVGRVSSFFETGHRLGADTFRGLAIGGIVIFFLLWVLFQSLPMALAGIFVNALPVLAGIGMMGILGIDIDMGSSIVAAVAFGIILDDSTHLLVRVQELVKAGYDPATSVARTIRELATPIAATTAAISLGFSVLLLAEMQPFNDFAVVILITLTMALLSDLLLLPLLVRRFFRDPIK